MNTIIFIVYILLLLIMLIIYAFISDSRIIEDNHICYPENIKEYNTQ